MSYTKVSHRGCPQGPRLHRDKASRACAGVACPLALLVAASLALVLPSLALAQFGYTPEATVSYSMGGYTWLAGVQENYGDVQSITTQNPLAQPAVLAGSIGGEDGSGDYLASLFANATLEGSAGLMRARLDGSTSITRVSGNDRAEARLNIASAKVGWKDGYIVIGNPADPQPGRPLLVQAVLNVTGGMTGETIIPDLYRNSGNYSILDLKLLLTAKDQFQRNLLAIAPPYNGSFAERYVSTLSGLDQSRPAPGTIPLLLMVNEGSESFLNFELEVRATAVSQSSGILPPEPWSTATSFNADYGHTFAWGGITSVVDANTGQPVPGWSITSASGVDYASAIPEPSAVLALLAVATVRRLWRRGTT